MSLNGSWGTALKVSPSFYDAGGGGDPNKDKEMAIAGLRGLSRYYRNYVLRLSRKIFSQKDLILFGLQHVTFPAKKILIFFGK